MLRFWITSEARRRFAGHHHGRLAGTSLGETAEPLNTSPSLAGTPLLRRTPHHHHGRLAGTPPRVPSQARRRFAGHRTTITGGSQARRSEFRRQVFLAAARPLSLSARHPPLQASRASHQHRRSITAAQSFVARYGVGCCAKLLMLQGVICIPLVHHAYAPSGAIKMEEACKATGCHMCHTCKACSFLNCGILYKSSQQQQPQQHGPRFQYTMGPACVCVHYSCL